MVRVFVALTFFFINLYACKGEYHLCIDKIKHSQTIKKNSLYIPISKDKRLVFSLTKPKAKILKHDPFLSLYIIEDKEFKYPFVLNKDYPVSVALVSNKESRTVDIVTKQIGLNRFAQIQKNSIEQALVLNSCCFLEGILTQRGIIEKDYIKRFVETKDIRYGDIGIRVKDTRNGVLVTSYDPFMKNNPFLKGDYIIAIDSKSIKNSASLMKNILFSKVGSRRKVKIRRDGKILFIDVQSQERLSGGYKIETYLEKYGLTFDKNLNIMKIDNTKTFYGLLIGDKLLKVNGHNVTNQEDVMKYISDFKFHPKLLFERDENFQFFVNMD